MCISSYHGTSALYLLNSCESLDTQFYKGLGHCLHLTPINPDNKQKDINKQYMNAASGIYGEYLFYKFAFNLLKYLLFPAFITVTSIGM